MTPDEAAMVLREATKTNAELAFAIAQIVDRSECIDLYEWVEENPGYAILLAEVEVEASAQLAEYARQLEGGATGDRTNDEPST